MIPFNPATGKYDPACGVSGPPPRRPVGPSSRLVRVLSFAAMALITAGPAASHADHDEPTYAPAADPERFADAIAAFEQADRDNPPPQHAALFVGSSSIRGWDLDRWFPDLETINRGFGGSHLADAYHFADRIIIPYNPRVIVLYAGDNDIAAGLSPEQVYDHFRLLIEQIHTRLPHTPVVFLAIKPSTARWSLYPKMRAANELIRERCRHDGRLIYVDLESAMLNDAGEPRTELLAGDGLHLSDAGYAAWTELVRTHVQPGDRDDDDNGAGNAARDATPAPHASQDPDGE